MNRALCLGGLLLLATSPARAEDPPLVSGFATATYGGNFDQRRPQFSLEQAELTAAKTLSPRGSIRVDLEWTWDGTDWVAAVEQGWMEYRPERVSGLVLTAGRFNAPIGFELLDTPDMYQISHSLVFNYGTPANLTGLMGAYPLGGGFDLKAYAANDWERNSENNAVPTFGGRVGWTQPGRIAGGLSVLSGKRDESQVEGNTVVDLDLSLTPSERLLIGAEFNLGTTSVADQDRSWTGFLVMAHYRLHPGLGLTGRFDLLDDPDDLLFGSGLGEQRSSVTGACAVELGPGMQFLSELRLDRSSEDVFSDHDGKAKSQTVGGALALCYSF
ncbi:MAG: outer membrane beta-barrel protein [Candidatus Eisenbacteria bacterium]|nr:outer membrane beta-barrel protein [Candidatus Eisenbacteria bacterium]